MFSSLIFGYPYDNPISQTRKLRLGGVDQLAQDNITGAGRAGTQHEPDSESQLSLQTPHFHQLQMHH